MRTLLIKEKCRHIYSDFGGISIAFIQRKFGMSYRDAKKVYDEIVLEFDQKKLGVIN